MASRLLLQLISLALIVGCSSQSPRTIPGADIAQRELPALQAKLSTAPDDPDLNYRVGEALFALHRSEEAAAHLDRALDADPSLTEAAIILAAIQENEGQFAAAEATLIRVETRNAGEKELVEVSLERVGRAQNKERMRKLLAEESELETSDIPEKTLAVHSFEADPSAWEISNLGKALSHVLVADFSELKELRLVERRKLQTLTDEIELTGSDVRRRGATSKRGGLAPVNQLMGVQQRLALLTGKGGDPLYNGDQTGENDEATKDAIRAFQTGVGLKGDGIPGPRTQAALEEAVGIIVARKTGGNQQGATISDEDFRLRAGRLLGARRLIAGNFSTGDEGYLTVRAQLFNTVDGSIEGTMECEQGLADFHKIPGDLVVKTADALQLELTDDERRHMLSHRPPTKSLAAFLAFGKGLDLEDRGEIGEAHAAYAEAVRLDPNFKLAQKMAKRTEMGASTIQQVIERIRR